MTYKTLCFILWLRIKYTPGKTRNNTSKEKLSMNIKRQPQKIEPLFFEVLTYPIKEFQLKDLFCFGHLQCLLQDQYKDISVAYDVFKDF